MFMLASRTSVAECITFFVAFHVLTAIDNIYAEGLADFSLQEAVEKPLVYTKESYKIKLQSRSFSQQIYRIVFVTLHAFYLVVYYYFTPFFISFIPYISPGLPV